MNLLHDLLGRMLMDLAGERYERTAVANSSGQVRAMACFAHSATQWPDPGGWTRAVEHEHRAEQRRAAREHAGSGAAPELTVEDLIPLGAITGGSAPVLVGDDGDAVGGYTSACAVLTPELIRIALSISAETTNDVDRTGTPDGEPVTGVWPARCGWHASYVGGPTGGVDVWVSLPIPGAISIDYDAAHESYLDVGEAIELPSVGDRCYVARGFARCPFGNGSGEISIGVNATGARKVPSSRANAFPITKKVNTSFVSITQDSTSFAPRLLPHSVCQHSNQRRRRPYGAEGGFGDERVV